MSSGRFVRATLALLSAALIGGCATRPQLPAEPVKVRVLAINDFHGHLKPPAGGLRTIDPARPGQAITVAAGGAEQLATQVERLRAGQRHHVFVAAGDLIGATPLLSALFRDEPTIEAMNLIGLAASAVGNHEFDKGAQELLRLQRGGCHPTDGCKGPWPFKGAEFQYLAASTIVKATGKTLLPPYVVRRFDGIDVAFIGLTLEGTPRIVAPDGVAGLRFRDEAETVNALVPELRARGIEAIVVLIHEGGLPSGGHNECPGISGPIVDIVSRFDKAVDIVISGHTHRAYNCRIDGRLVTSGDSYGRIVTAIDLVLDPATRDVASAVADNTIVGIDLPKEPRLTALIEAYDRLAAPLARRIVGRIAAPLSRETDAAGASPLGQVVADAQLAATRDAGAQFALMNPGGIRAQLPMPADGLVRYEDLFAVQPFSNQLVTMTLSGEQLLKLLESQWTPGRSRVLLVSRGLSYSWDAARPPGQRIVRDSVRIDGAPLDPAARYRVTVNSYLAAGGDGFSILKKGTERRTGITDVDALERYLRDNPGLAPPALDRVTRIGPSGRHP